MAYASARILSPKIMKDSNFKTLGFNAMATCYITFGICSFFSAPLVTKMGDKWSLFVGTMCLGVYSGVFILPLELHEADNVDPTYHKIAYAVVMLGAVVNGIGESILWVGAGHYVSLCASDSNKGKFNSVFLGIFML